MIAEADIKKMTKEERLETIHMLWDSMLRSPEDEPDSPDWHREVLEERMRKIEAGDVKFYSLEECRAKFEELKARERS